MPAGLRRRTTALAAAVAALALLTSCGTAENAFTSQQGPSGNGAFRNVADLKIANVTLVAGPDGSRSATMIGNITNVGTEPDVLTAVEVLDPAAPASITTRSVLVAARAFDPVGLGYPSDAEPPFVNFYGVDLPLSHFVPVRLSFRNAGNVDLDVLVVPAVGIYEGIAPTPAGPQASNL